ncbi:MAG: glycine--tRNA ligase [Candidatus Marsarchaeota archaeon]|nr:glycine--tRNA ligase [Candidatus Marsarchaeota archaeon]MCL5413162.1 glycine--tRNA ligase [Candidatus Marsarchaeota archaeon]
MNLDDLVALAKSRGFFWPAAEIYGGASGIYDYGHVGALLKKRFETAWTSFFVESNDNYYLLDAANILPEKPLVASGHAALFNDILIACTKCKTHYRADVLLSDVGIRISEGANSAEIDDAVEKNGVKCPKCKGAMAKSKPFNMMFDLYLGPERTEKAYLRPETAQSVYLNFYREFNILRKKLPMGLALIGRAYRNEISPRQGLYRLRELIQAELQIFFDPENFEVDFERLAHRTLSVFFHGAGGVERLTVKEIVEKRGIPRFYAYHMALIDLFYTLVLRIPEHKFRFLEKGADSRAFYNKIHMDIEVDVESWGGFKEVGGIHYRTDYDLSSHSKGSNKDMSVSVGGKKFMPHVLELSFGVDRNVWALVDTMFGKIGERSVLQIPNYLAPFAAGIFPLQHDEILENKAREIYTTFRTQFRIEYDDSGSIGKRYARMDEIGTPFCITVDYDTVDSNSQNYNTVTVRHRDDKKQERAKVIDLGEFLSKNTAFDIGQFLKKSGLLV